MSDIHTVTELPAGLAIYESGASLGNLSPHYGNSEKAKSRQEALYAAADCIPLVIYDSAHHVLALVHLGWTGTSYGLYAEVLKYMSHEYNTQPADCFYYLGPSIKEDSYRKESLALPLQTKEWEPYVSEKAGDYTIDLQGYVVDNLKRCGANPDSIRISCHDTGDPASDYLSPHRANNHNDPEGRNGLLVVMR